MPIQIERKVANRDDAWANPPRDKRFRLASAALVAVLCFGVIVLRRSHHSPWILAYMCVPSR